MRAKLVVDCSWYGGSLGSGGRRISVEGCSGQLADCGHLRVPSPSVAEDCAALAAASAAVEDCVEPD